MTDWLNKTHIGDCRELLARMAADGVRVQTCVTSPPYFGLRDYGTASWKGGNATCDHMRAPVPLTADSPGRRFSTINDTRGSGTIAASSARTFRGTCGKCGAIRIDNQIGLEPSPAEYVEQMVAVFRLVRDLLADDGTLWLNLGDSYAGGGGFWASAPSTASSKSGKYGMRGALKAGGIKPSGSIKTKDLLGIPWRVAFALQSDGWYLRSDIIWAKPNPMPESVTDRPTKAHEYLFLLAKSERYYFDNEALKEPTSQPERVRADPIGGQKYVEGVKHSDGAIFTGSERRNRRSVWLIPTTPFAGAHFACFPRALIEPCILAGSRSSDTVLDPFMGSGTVAQVATDLGRNFIGCELNPKYVDLHEMRRTTIGMPI